MTAKEYLSQVLIIESSIKRLDQELKQARDELVVLRSPWPDGQPHGSGDTSDPVGNKATQLADTIARICDEQLVLRARLWRIRWDVLQTIVKVKDPLLQEILYSHYVGGKSFKKIGEQLHYSRRHVLRKHDEALDAIDAIIKSCP